MERMITEMPTPEVLGWYLSGSSGGRDGMGVAVRLNIQTKKLEPDGDFAQRVENYQPDENDPFNIREMPDLGLLDDYLANRGVVYDLETRRFERSLTPVV